MPDDTTISAEIAEQDKLEAEAKDEFDIDDDDNGEVDDDDGKKDDKDDSGGLKGDNDDDKDNDDKDGEKELTPKEIAEMRAGIKDDKKKKDTNNPLLGDLFGDDDEPDDDQGNDDDEKGKDAKKKKDVVTDPDDDDFDIDEYKSAYPEDYAAIKKIAEKMVADLVGDKKDAEYVSKEDFDAAIAEIQLATMVTGKHPDAERITAIDDDGNLTDEKFAGWINEQPKAIQRLFVSTRKDMGTAAEDFIAGLDYYKDSIKQEKASDHDQKSRDKKNKKDALHKHTMRTKPSKKTSGKTIEDEEAEAKEIFEAED